MSLSLYKCVANLVADSGLPEDTYNNDWYFEGISAGPTQAADAAFAAARVVEAYTTIPTGATKSISDYLGPQVDIGSMRCSVVVYAQELANLGDPWGSPVWTQSFTMPAPDASTPLPAEVAVAFSYHGDLTDVPETAANPSPPPAVIRPASRRRGRMFIGPLNTLAGATQSGTNDMGVTGVLRDTLGFLGDALVLDNGVDDINWVVYSPTALETHVVTGGFIDSAFDIQRRRGSAALARDTWGT